MSTPDHPPVPPPSPAPPAPPSGASPQPPRRSGRTAPRPDAHPEGWQLGRLGGVPVILARSWFVIAVIITVTFEPVVQQTDPTLGRATTYSVALAYAVLLGLSVLVHEVAHALTARAFSLPATRIVLTLWGGHTQFETDVPTPGRSFAVAVAGPLANAVLGVLAWEALQHVGAPRLVLLLLSALAVTNGFVAVTNVLPGLPLDGGRLLEAVVWRLSGDRDLGTVAAGWAGRVVAVAVPVAALAWPLAHSERPSLLTVVWFGALGALLWAGAGSALSAARVRRRAPGASVTALARPAVAVPADTALSRALAASAAVPGGAWVVLTDPQGAPVGVLDPDAVAAVPEHRRAWVPASSAARALPPGAEVPPSLSGQELLRALSDAPSGEWVVREASGQVSGLLLARDVVGAVMGPRAAART